MEIKGFRVPENIYRPYMIQHSSAKFPEAVEYLAKEGFGGVVMNCEWHGKDSDIRYLCNDADFENLDGRIALAKEKNFGVWLYDEKGYPSASADGLTLEGHPEYEARGLAQIVTDGKDYVLDNDLEKIIYACRKDGSPVEFTDREAKGADFVYAVKIAFEGSHAERCGWGPRRYPNLMNRAAVRAFIDNTYEAYYSKLKNFDKFEAVFTDEPSLMSGYVNCPQHMKYALVAWDYDLPAVYKAKFGTEVYPTLPCVFSEDEGICENKIRYWETVGDMVREAYFVQLADWCCDHGLPFSGHCLLEECIDEHVPLYGNLVTCLKALGRPGVDILTGDPVDYEGQGFPYYMASQYVGSAARMTGKTESVMVEVCPIQHGAQDYSFEQERGTLDKIFFAGINHINSYLSADRLKGRYIEYADHAARLSAILCNSKWNGRIGMYYPIETVQGSFRPSHIGVNTGAYSGKEAQNCLRAIDELTLALRRAELDSTIVDSEWIEAAEIKDDTLTLNGLTINTLVFPNALYLKPAAKTKLLDWQKQGGTLIFAVAAPEGYEVCADPIAAAKAAAPCEPSLSGMKEGSLWINRQIYDGKDIWFIVNASNEAQSIELGGRYTILDPDSGDIYEGESFTVECYSAFFIMK